MTEQTCANCGHEERMHSDIACWTMWCRCKKFKPKKECKEKNHNPVHNGVCGETCEECKTAEIKTLSDKITFCSDVHFEKGFGTEILLMEDVKNFIKELKDKVKSGELVRLSDFIDEIDKRAGKNLI